MPTHPLDCPPRRRGSTFFSFLHLGTPSPCFLSQNFAGILASLHSQSEQEGKRTGRGDYYFKLHKTIKTGWAGILQQRLLGAHAVLGQGSDIHHGTGSLACGLPPPAYLPTFCILQEKGRQGLLSLHPSSLLKNSNCLFALLGMMLYSLCSRRTKSLLHPTPRQEGTLVRLCDDDSVCSDTYFAFVFICAFATRWKAFGIKKNLLFKTSTGTIKIGLAWDMEKRLGREAENPAGTQGATCLSKSIEKENYQSMHMQAGGDRPVGLVYHFTHRNIIPFSHAYTSPFPHHSLELTSLLCLCLSLPAGRQSTSWGGQKQEAYSQLSSGPINLWLSFYLLAPSPPSLPGGSMEDNLTLHHCYHSPIHLFAKSLLSLPRLLTACAVIPPRGRREGRDRRRTEKNWA